MRISDWSSDVCSSDLVGRRGADIGCGRFRAAERKADADTEAGPESAARTVAAAHADARVEAPRTRVGVGDVLPSEFGRGVDRTAGPEKHDPFDPVLRRRILDGHAADGENGRAEWREKG